MSEPDLVALGERLHALRTEARLSVRDLSERADISISYLRVLEGGQNSKTRKPSRPSVQHLERLGRILGDEEELLRLAGWASDGVTTASRPAGPSNDAADYIRELRDASRSLARRTPFMRERAVHRLRDFSVDFGIVASGTLSCEPEDEPYLTRLAVRSCRSHLRAVSYQDLEWWGSTSGEQYRQEHEDLLAKDRDIEITRIFLVTPEEYAILQPTFEWHRELGIRTFVLDVGSDWISPHYLKDYVIYDDQLVRVAEPSTDDRKQAVFTDDPNRVRDRLNNFEILRQRAELFGGSEAWNAFLKNSEGGNA